MRAILEIVARLLTTTNYTSATLRNVAETDRQDAHPRSGEKDRDTHRYAAHWKKLPPLGERGTEFTHVFWRRTAMLDVRSIYVSELWDEYQAYRVARETDRLYPHRTLVEHPFAMAA
jgi:hypothetical protein